MGLAHTKIKQWSRSSKKISLCYYYAEKNTFQMNILLSLDPMGFSTRKLEWLGQPERVERHSSGF